MELLQFKTVFLRPAMMEIITKMKTLHGKLEYSSLIIIHYNLYLLKLMSMQAIENKEYKCHLNPVVLKKLAMGQRTKKSFKFIISSFPEMDNFDSY